MIGGDFLKVVDIDEDWLIIKCHFCSHSEEKSLWLRPTEFADADEIWIQSLLSSLHVTCLKMRKETAIARRRRMAADDEDSIVLSSVHKYLLLK